MPLFKDKFAVPKFPTRKASSLSNLANLDSSIRSQEFGMDIGPVRARLGNQDVIFQDGQWVIGDGCGSGDNTNGRDMVRVRKENQQLIEENNLLKLKIDILLDMLSETTAEVHLQENEIDNLRDLLKNNPIANKKTPALVK